MKDKRKGNIRRFFSMLLAAVMVLSAVPVEGVLLPVYAEEGKAGLCEHHTEHTAACGYQEAQPGADCTHEHTESCYKTTEECVHEHTSDCYPEKPTDEELAAEGVESGEPTNCSHDCQSGGDGTEDGCIRKELNCPHENGEHEDACGYTEGTEGSPCAYVCDICKVQDAGQDSGQNTGNADQEECVCEIPCTVEQANGDCPVCGVEGADLTACKGEPEQDTNHLNKVISAWEWMDENGFLNNGVLAMPKVSVENPVTFEQVVSMLPEGITATVEEAEESEVITVSGWECDAFAEEENADGQTEGSFTFTAGLPEGYELKEDAKELAVEVQLGGGMTLEGDEVASVTIEDGSTINYANIIDAFAAAEKAEKATVTLLKSVTLSGGDCITINGGNITFKGEGFILSGENKSAGNGIFTVEGGKLIMTSGEVRNSESNGKGVYVGSGSVEISDGKVSGGKIGVDVNAASGASAKISGGEVIGRQTGVQMSGDGSIISSVEISGGKISGQQGIHIDAPQGSMKIMGGEVIGESDGVEIMQGGLSISDGEVIGESDGVLMHGGSMEISGGEVTGGYSGVGIGISTAYKYDISVQFNGGKVSGKRMGVHVQRGSVEISDGEVIGEYTGVEIYGGSLIISGGSFSGINCFHKDLSIMPKNLLKESFCYRDSSGKIITLDDKQESISEPCSVSLIQFDKDAQVVLIGAENLVYSGEEYRPEISVILEGKTLAEGSDYTVSYADNTSAGTATVTVTGIGDYASAGTATVTFSIAQSGTELEGLAVDQAGGKYVYGETITVTAKPKITGIAVKPVPSGFRMASRSFTGPKMKEMAVYCGATQVSEPAAIGADGNYTMTVDTADVIAAGRAVNESTNLTVRFTGDDDMATAEGSVSVTITAEAKVEIGGSSTYVDTLKNAFAAASGKTATVTMLKDVTLEPGSNITITSGEITLEGGDYILSGTDIALTEGVLTVKGGKLFIANVVVQAQYKYGYGIIVENNSSAEINGGMIESSWIGVQVQSGGSVQINDGTIEGSSSGVQVDAGSAIINGGTVSSYSGSYEYEGYGVEVVSGNVKISGGVIEGRDIGLHFGAGSAEIGGGTFSGGTHAISINPDFIIAPPSLKELLETGYCYKDTSGQIITLESGQKEITQEVTVSKADFAKEAEAVATDAENVIYDGTVKEPAVSVSIGGVPLKEGTDYIVKGYENNINAGTDAKIILTGTGAYSGEAVLPFTIKPRALEAGNITLNLSTNGSGSAYYYTGKAITPAVTVNCNGKELVQGTDYTISCTDNTAVHNGTGENVPTVTVTGTGNYTGTPAKAFAIAYYETATAATAPGWTNHAEITAPTGFTISPSLDGTYGGSFSYNTETGKEGTEVSYYLKQDTTGFITDAKTVTVKVDTTAPSVTGEGEGIKITDRDEWWQQLLNTLTFGAYKKQQVEVKASDSLSGIGKIYYYIDSAPGETPLTKEQLDGLGAGQWREKGSMTFGLDAEGNYVVYAYAVDQAGNKSAYISSDGITIDTTAPQLMWGLRDSEQDTSITKRIVMNEAGTISYVVLLGSEYSSITAEEIIGHEQKQVITVNEAQVNRELEFRVTGLTANTSYMLCLTGTDTAGNTGEVANFGFSTKKTLPVITTQPQLSGTYGTAVADMVLIPGVAQTGGSNLEGTWSVTDTAKAETPFVGTAKTYEVTFTPTDSNTYDNVMMKIPVTVTERSLTATGVTVTEAAGSYPYNGTAQTPPVTIGIGTPTEGIFLADSGADLTAEDFTVSYSSNTNAGEASITITGKGNYTGTVTRSFTIEKAEAIITVESGKESYDKTFGDSAFTLEGITENSNDASCVQYRVTTGEDVVSVANGTVTIKQAGTAQITLSLPESANYQAAADVAIDISVARKGGYTTDTINRSYYYAKDIADRIGLTELLPADCGTVIYGTPAVSGDVTLETPAIKEGILAYTVKSGTEDAAGTVTVVAESVNYEDITLTVNLRLIGQLPVALKTGTTVTLQSSALTYGQPLSALQFNHAVFVEQGTDTEVQGTLAWKHAADLPDAGTASATWVFTPDEKKYASLEGIVPITVAKAAPTVTAAPTVAERVYHPDKALADSDLKKGTVTGLDGKELTGNWSWQSAGTIPTANNSGYTAVFTADNANYSTVTRTITVTVTRAEPYVSSKPTAAAITYGDALGASVLTGGDTVYSSTENHPVAGTFAWKDKTLKPAPADSGKTAYAVTFTPADGSNYKAVETTLTLTVNPADNPPEMPDSTMNVAKSCEKVSDVVLPTDWAWQEADQDIPLEIETPVTVTAVYIGADQENYKNVTVSVTITRIDCDHINTAIEFAIEATCQKKGYTGDIICWDCCYLLKLGTEIPLADHKGGTPSCTKPAVCSVCEQPYGSIDSSRHLSMERRGTVAATCTAGGYTGDAYCTDCGTKTGTGTATAALGHHYSGKVTEEPTGSEEGIRTYTCERCSHSYTERIPKLPEESHHHSYTGRVTKEADCTNSGAKTYTCSCGDHYTETVPAKGHRYISRVTTQPTVQTEGVMTYTCDRCGHSYTRAIARLQGQEELGAGAEAGTDINPGNTPEGNQPGNTPEGVRPGNALETGTDQAEANALRTGRQGGQPENQPDQNAQNGTQEDQSKTGSGKENRPKAGEPFIEGSAGEGTTVAKSGWDTIRSEAEQARNGEHVTIDMNGATVVPGDVLTGIKGKDITLVFDMGNGITWSINGKSITAETAGDIDFHITAGLEAGKNIPAEVINTLTGERYAMNITLAYEGEFGFSAVLSIDMQEENAGLYANLFYYNESTGEMEFICANQIAKDGVAELTFTHASDYVIVVDEEPAGEAEDRPDAAAAEQGLFESGIWKPFWIILLGAVVVLVGVGVFWILRTKKADDDSDSF